jgi:hypothetical protein
VTTRTSGSAILRTSAPGSAGANIVSVVQAGDLESAYLELMTRTARDEDLEAAA